MVSDGSGEIGANKLTNEVLMIMTSVCQTVKNMTGVDITQQLSRSALGGSRVNIKRAHGFETNAVPTNNLARRRRHRCWTIHSALIATLDSKFLIYTFLKLFFLAVCLVSLNEDTLRRPWRTCFQNVL
jgi:hypothetical protein